MTVNPKEVQGWNGFTIVRSTEGTIDFDFDVQSMQIEADLITDGFDLLDMPE